MQTQSQGTTGTVLIVDDEPGIRALSRRILQSAGYQVLEAEHGAAGVAEIEKGTPLDLLIADLDMPVMNGADMAKRVKTLRPDLPILYVTAHISTLLDAQQTLADGEAYLSKPFTRLGLLEAVSLLRTGRLTDGMTPAAAKEGTLVEIKPGLLWRLAKRLREF